MKEKLKEKGFTVEYAVLLGLWLTFTIARGALAAYQLTMDEVSIRLSGAIVWSMLLLAAVQFALFLLLAVRCRWLPYLAAAVLKVALEIASYVPAGVWSSLFTGTVTRYLINTVMIQVVGVAAPFALARLLTLLLKDREWAVYHILLGLWLVWQTGSIFIFMASGSLQLPPVSYLPTLITAAVAAAVYWLVILVSGKHKKQKSSEQQEWNYL